MALQKFHRLTGLLRTGKASLGGTTSEGRCCDQGTSLRCICQVHGCLEKCQIRVGVSVPAARMKGGYVFWVVKMDKAVKASSSNKTLSIDTAGSLIPVNMWTIKIASIKNGVREHWNIRRLQSRRWRFVDIDDSTTINVHAQPLSLQCSRGLINTDPFLPVMEKRGKAMLPAKRRPS